MRDHESAERAMKKFMGRSTEEVFPSEMFIGSSFEQAILAFHATCLLTWGFHPRLQYVKPDVIEHFLRDRMKHFDNDLPHSPLFGTSPGEWPES